MQQDAKSTGESDGEKSDCPNVDNHGAKTEARDAEAAQPGVYANMNKKTGHIIPRLEREEEVKQWRYGANRNSEKGHEGGPVQVPKVGGYAGPIMNGKHGNQESDKNAE